MNQLKENKTDNNQLRNTKKFLNGMIYAFNILSDDKDNQKLLYLNIKETKIAFYKFLILFFLVVTIYIMILK